MVIKARRFYSIYKHVYLNSKNYLKAPDLQPEAYIFDCLQRVFHVHYTVLTFS